MKRVGVSELQEPFKELLRQVGGVNGRDRLTEFLVWLNTPPNRWVKIHRGRFVSTEFVGHGWKLSQNETDRRSATLKKLDLTKVELVTMLKANESYISGEESLKRLKTSRFVRLDTDTFIALWNKKELIPEAWKEKKNGKTRCIFFFGKILEDPDLYRHGICLYWDVQTWKFRTRWLLNTWDDCDSFAVIPI